MKKVKRKPKSFQLDPKVVERYLKVIERDALKAGRTLEKIILNWVEKNEKN